MSSYILCHILQNFYHFKFMFTKYYFDILSWTISWIKLQRSVCFLCQKINIEVCFLKSTPLTKPTDEKTTYTKVHRFLLNFVDFSFCKHVWNQIWNVYQRMHTYRWDAFTIIHTTYYLCITGDNIYRWNDKTISHHYFS